MLKAVDPATLSSGAALNREIVIYGLEQNLVAYPKFGVGSVQRPYDITQQDGNYFGIPDFLNSTHPVETAADAEAYLSRLSEFAKLLDYETDDQRAQAARGDLAPGWSLDLALGQIRLAARPAGRHQRHGHLARRPRQGQGHPRRLDGPARPRSSSAKSSGPSTARWRC